MGLVVRERQLSGPGKQYVASAWRPEITEEEAIAWFDYLKTRRLVTITLEDATDLDDIVDPVPLQQYLQRMLQGARDRWGKDFWTDKLIPAGRVLDLPHLGWVDGGWLAWWEAFVWTADPAPLPRAGVADLALISDLRQESEAVRVKELGGYIVEMQRPELEHAYVTGKDHITEKRLSDIRPDLVDYIIVGSAEHNDETFAQLKQDCAKAWREFAQPLLEAT